MSTQEHAKKCCVKKEGPRRGDFADLSAPFFEYARARTIAHERADIHVLMLFDDTLFENIRFLIRGSANSVTLGGCMRVSMHVFDGFRGLISVKRRGGD